MPQRVFLAIDLPKEVRHHLRKSYDSRLPVRWTKVENLHVTLNFLGDLNDEEMEEVLEIAEKVCIRHPPVVVKFEKVLPFHYMIWASIKPNRALEKLYADLNAEFRQAGLGRPQHQTFHPHICLARGKDEQKLKDLAEQEVPNLRFTATHIVVFESVLSSQGPKYTSLDAFELKGGKHPLLR